MDLIRLAEQAKAGIEKGKKLAQTLEFMAIDDSSEHHYMCTRMFVDSFYQNKHFPLYNGEQYRHKKIKIAYVSPDFREHPVGHLMMEVVANHNREAFELTIISIGVNDNSEIRTKFEELADIFVDAHTQSSLEIANYIHERKIDIAIDLAGFTHDSRVEIFQRRPAPIQINYLGYPGTMAMDCYDYIIADRTVIPPADEKNYKEKVAYLDCCYLPIPYGKNVSDPKSKLSYGLPENGFIFCAFNHTYKIFPEIFQIWMKLLKENPESVIWLTATSTEASRNLIKNALDNGVSSERLIFAGRINSISEHLARYNVADLFLDTWPYNAHTTCADALSVGLPVVTLKGNSFPSKVAASLLEEVGLAELISESKQEYFEIADKLAKDKNLLLNLRQRLQPNAEFLTKNLNSEFTKKLENLFTSLNRNIRQKDITNEVNV
jgi:protein O-GlcNAc transferase